MILADPFKCPRTVMDVIFAVRFGDADADADVVSLCPFMSKF